MDRKAYLRTLEAIIAIFITFFFLAYITPEKTPSESGAENIHILPELSKSLAFRNCVLSQNVSCINTTIDDSIPNQYNFLFNLSSNPHVTVALPNKRVFGDASFIVGNSTSYKPTILRLYYWSR